MKALLNTGKLDDVCYINNLNVCAISDVNDEGNLKCIAIYILIEVRNYIGKADGCNLAKLYVVLNKYQVELLLRIYSFRLHTPRLHPDVRDDCNVSPSCHKCLRKNTNPECGWCTLRNRCSRETNCPGNKSSSDFWVTGSDRCPKIRAVKPHVIAASAPRLLHITIPHLPNYDGIFVCAFEVLGRTSVTKGKGSGSEIVCASPQPETIPRIPSETNHMPVKLSVRTPNGPDFAATSNFTIYDCSRITSCSECATSQFPCVWCVVGHRCTHDVSENCRNDILVFSKSVTRPTFRHGPGYCFGISPQSNNEESEILVHSGTKKRIVVKVDNIMIFHASSRFTCKVGSMPEEIGLLLGDMIYCDTMNFRVVGRQPVSNLSLSILLGGGGKLDNPQNLHVVVYHCGLMASNCGECLDLPERYGCGWCEESKTCTIRDNCESDSSWMDDKHTCKEPEITSIHPKAGLLTRQTNITIRGVNLPKNFEDIHSVGLIDENNQVVAGCSPWEHQHVRHTQIVCLLDIPETQPHDNSTVRGGIIEVKFSKHLVALSEEEFVFVNPSISEIHPVKGVLSGGTVLKISGLHLDAGNEVEAFVGDIPCNVVSRESSSIQCVTSPVPREPNGQLSPQSGAVRVIFDGEERTLSSYFFYVADPYIRSVMSASGSRGPVGTPSGGNAIIVEGENFDCAPNPYIYVIVEEVEYPGICNVESDQKMLCVSPRIPSEAVNFCGEDGGYLTFHYGFRMGEVQSVQNVSLSEEFGPYRLYPDPYFMPFSEEQMIKTFKSDYITIKGSYLDSVLEENDIAVSIGGEACTVTSLTHTELTCKPPKAQMDAKKNDWNKLPEVVVRLYGSQEYFIGFLRYER